MRRPASSPLNLSRSHMPEPGDGMGLRTDGAIGVLPHGPGRPIGGHDSGGSMLRQPEPAIGEDRVGIGAEQVLDVVARIESGYRPVWSLTWVMKARACSRVMLGP